MQTPPPILPFISHYLDELGPAAASLRERLRERPEECRDIFQQAFQAAGRPDRALELAESAGRRLPELAPCESGPGQPTRDEALSERCDQVLSSILQAAGKNSLRLSLQLVTGFPGLAAALPEQVFVDAPMASGLSTPALTFLLAHEVGHLVHQDHLAEAGRNLALELVVGSVDGFDLGAMERLEPLLESERERALKQEEEADKFAGQVLRKLGHDPQPAAHEVLELLYHNPAAAEHLAQSHGTLEQRVQRASQD